MSATIIDNSVAIGREKLFGSLLYGAIAGAAFAGFLWGWDAVRLFQLHGFFPWFKLVLGLAFCISVGSLAGWLAGRARQGWISAMCWIALAGSFAWISVSLPLQIFPAMATWFNSDLNQYLAYVVSGGAFARLWLSFVWIVILISIAGLLQPIMVEFVVFGVSIASKVFPFLACIVLCGIAASTLDNLINDPFRKAMLAVEAPIQFLLEHRGETIAAADARRAHIFAFSAVEELVTEERNMVISAYDQTFTRVNVLLRFETAWIECTTVFGQASFCRMAEPFH